MEFILRIHKIHRSDSWSLSLRFMEFIIGVHGMHHWDSWGSSNVVWEAASGSCGLRCLPQECQKMVGHLFRARVLHSGSWVPLFFVSFSLSLVPSLLAGILSRILCVLTSFLAHQLIHTRTHTLTLVFSDSVTTLRRKAMERHGERSKDLKVF